MNRILAAATAALIVSTGIAAAQSDPAGRPINPSGITNKAGSPTVEGITNKAGSPTVEGITNKAGSPTVEGITNKAGSPTVEGITNKAGSPTVEGITNKAGKPTVEGITNKAGSPTVEGITNKAGSPTVEGIKNSASPLPPKASRTAQLRSRRRHQERHRTGSHGWRSKEVTSLRRIARLGALLPPVALMRRTNVEQPAQLPLGRLFLCAKSNDLVSSIKLIKCADASFQTFTR